MLAPCSHLRDSPSFPALVPCLDNRTLRSHRLQLATSQYVSQQRRRPLQSRHQIRCQSSGDAAEHSTATGAEAIVLVDHGSRREQANAMLDEIAELYRKTAQRKIVRTAHMELAHPSIAEAISECASLGASTVIIAPFFLSRGRHIMEDIPALVDAAAAEHPHLRCVIAEPLGTDDLLAQLIEKRVEAAISSS